MDTTRRYHRSLAEAFPRDHAAAIEIHRAPKEPLGWRVSRWVAVLVLLCMAGAIALGY